MKRFIYLLIALLSACGGLAVAQETPPTGLKPVNSQFFINLPDSAIWQNKGMPFGWQRLARTKELIDSLNGVVHFNGRSYQQINSQVSINGMLNAHMIQMFAGYNPDAGQVSMGNFLAIGANASDRNRSIGLFSGTTKDWEFGEDASHAFFLNSSSGNVFTINPTSGEFNLGSHLLDAGAVQTGNLLSTNVINSGGIYSPIFSVGSGTSGPKVALTAPLVTTGRSQTLQDKDGVIALIGDAVPYSGALTNVDIRPYDFNANHVSADNFITAGSATPGNNATAVNGGSMNFIEGNFATSMEISHEKAGDSGADVRNIIALSKIANVQNSRDTIAYLRNVRSSISSSVAGYLPLTGGTLSGNLLTGSGSGLTIDDQSISKGESSIAFAAVHLNLNYGTGGYLETYAGAQHTAHFGTNADDSLIWLGTNATFIGGAMPGNYSSSNGSQLYVTGTASVTGTAIDSINVLRVRDINLTTTGTGSATWAKVGTGPSAHWGLNIPTPNLSAYFPITGGTITGSETINSNSLSSSALALDVNKNTSPTFVQTVSSYDPNSEIVRFVNADNQGSALTLEAYGTTGGHNVYGTINMRAARGTLAAPSAIQSGDLIGQIQAVGYGTTGYGITTNPFIRFQAAENYTDVAKGTRIQLVTTPISSTNLVFGAQLDEYNNFAVQSTGAIATAVFQVNQIGTYMPGLVSTTSGSGTVTGTNTQFTNNYKVGQPITINGESQAITAIASDVSMTTNNWTGTNTNAHYSANTNTLFKIYGNGNAELSRGYFNIINNSVGSSSTDGLVLSNLTPSSSGTTRQYSSRIHFTGSAYNTTSSSSESQDAIMELRSSTGTNTSGIFAIAMQNAGGGYTDRFTLSTAGTAIFGASINPDANNSRSLGTASLTYSNIWSGIAHTDNVWAMGTGVQFGNNVGTLIGKWFGSTGNLVIGPSPTDNGNDRLQVSGTINATNNINTATKIGVTSNNTVSAMFHMNLGTYITNNAFSTSGLGIRQDATTYTSNATAGSVSIGAINSLGQPTLTASSAQTITSAYSLYLAGAPTAGTNVTIGSTYALGVNGNINMIGGVAALPRTIMGNAAVSTGSLSTSGIYLQVGGATITDVATTAGSTIALAAANSLTGGAITASNTGVTYTNASTLIINGAPTAGTNVTITNPYALYVAAGDSYFGGNLKINHVIGLGNAPAISAGAGAGTSPTVSVSGNDIGGEITINTGTSPIAASTIATITFNTAYGVAPYISLTRSSSTMPTDYYIGSRATNSFTITGTLAASTTYKFIYHVIQ